MSTIARLSIVLLFVQVCGAPPATHAQTLDRSPLSIPLRESVGWDNSPMIGTPEKPLPLSIVPAFPQLKFNDPMHIRWQADAERYFVCELGGKLWSFPHDPHVGQADLVVDLKSAIKSYDPERYHGVDSVYSLVFDPNFEENRFVYVCLIFATKSGAQLEDGSRISRFEVSRSEPPTIDVHTELPIISWLVGGHNGCDLAFDNSGCLLISTGDATAPAPPDGLNTGQDCSDLLSSILRIDVRQATREQPYQIPPDNPFLDMPGVRPEIWAFGFRNPWRIAIDEPSGELWVGDVGWEKWEMVHRVVRGGNYGWPIREGFELLRPEVEPGPSPILPPRIALPHTDSASITGGFVYRGQRLPAIADQYLFGDWTNGRIWAVPVDDHSPHAEVASGQLRIIAFEADRDGEPLIVNHLGETTLFRLEANTDYETELLASQAFPRRLSETGLFVDVARQQPASGVIRFEVNHPQWQDGAVGSHYLALPGQETVTAYNSPQPVDVLAMFNSRMHYPAGTVLAKTLTMPADPDVNRPSDVKLETQVLHFDGRLWRGYSYRWDTQQSDALLVDAAGEEMAVPGSDTLRWRIHSRSECLQCHNPWPETTLAFTPEQLHQPERGARSNWLQLVEAGFVVTKQSNQQGIAPEACVREPLVSHGQDVTRRARSYLHANCAHCHQNGAGAGVTLSLRMQDQADEMLAIDQRPTKGEFGILDSRIIAAGAPTQSALVYRMASSSLGHMPHIGAREVDFAGLALVSDWIEQMQEHSQGRQAGDRALHVRGRHLLEAIAQASIDDSPEKRSRRVEDALQLAIDLGRVRSEPLVEGKWPHGSQPTETWIVELAGCAEPLIASLFEAHLPAAQRERRLSPGAVYGDVANLTGDALRGQAYFFDATAGSQCAQCHRIGDSGGQVGPALDDIGLRQSPAQIFESIMEPSRVIDPRYQSQVVLTADGQVITGLLAETNADGLVLVNAQGERIAIASEEIEQRQTASTSLMPSGLGAGMTAQQMADVLAYLSTLKLTAGNETRE
jgi:putative heme-binding domain-containing protein